MTDNAQNPQINLLLTRPRESSIAFFDALSHETQQLARPIISPLIKISPLDSAYEILGSVIFSSVNGVKNSPTGNGRTAYCVGAMTTKSASAAGWDAYQMGETADELIANMKHKNNTIPLVHLGGKHRRGDIVNNLSKSGFQIQHFAVYDQPSCKLNPDAGDALASKFPLLLPLFSPRTANIFAGQCRGADHLEIIAFSAEVADQIKQLKFKSLTVLDRPTRMMMTEAVQNVAARMTLG